MFPWKSSHTVGIEITDQEIHLVHLIQRGNNIKRIKSASIFLPAGLVIEGTIGDSSAYKGEFSPKLKPWGRISNKINLLAPSQHVINRMIRVPDVKPRELYKIVSKEVQFTLHFPFDDPLWDFHDLGPSRDEDKKREIMVVAVSAKVINSQLLFLEQFGIKPTSVDIRGAALHRIVHRLIPVESVPETFAAFHINQSSSDLSIYHKNQLLFNRNISFQIEDKPQVEIAVALENKDEFEKQQIVSLVARDLLNEISRSISYFKFSILNKDVQLEKIYLTGEEPLLVDALIKDSIRNELNFEMMKDYLKSGRENPIDEKTVTALGLAFKEKGYRI